MACVKFADDFVNADYTGNLLNENIISTYLSTVMETRVSLRKILQIEDSYPFPDSECWERWLNHGNVIDPYVHGK